MVEFTSREISQDSIIAVLDSCYDQAIELFNSDTEFPNKLDKSVADYIVELDKKSETASAAMTNIITGLAIKVANPELDVRFHQTQIQPHSHVGESWFNHRGISEKIIYPWLSQKNFVGAKSGWQTRTLERPKPYTRDYDENIAHIKKAFIEIYESTEELSAEDVREELLYLIYLQILRRESKSIQLATPNIDQIDTILCQLETYINYKFKGKGGSRLPVLAICSIVRILTKELQRYQGVVVKDLELHSAADSQTGAAGDIELENSSGIVFEAYEIKHQITFTKAMIDDIAKKISPFQLDRYYALTTHANCSPTTDLTDHLVKLRQQIGCQIIVNGVFPTLKYYLRLLAEPQNFYAEFTSCLETDKSVTHEHREVWNSIILNE